MAIESAWNDPSYLRQQQYRDSTRLAGRANLHSYGRGDWFAWFARQTPWPVRGRVLELGCGRGAANAADLPLETGEGTSTPAASPLHLAAEPLSTCPVGQDLVNR